MCQRIPFCLMSHLRGADVYSYAPDEDKMVKETEITCRLFASAMRVLEQDPLLAKHLEHWGIDVMKLLVSDLPRRQLVKAVLMVVVLAVGRCPFYLSGCLAVGLPACLPDCLSVCLSSCLRWVCGQAYAGMR